MHVTVRLMGTLKKIAGKDKIKVSVTQGSDVENVIRKIGDSSESMKEELFDSLIDSPVPHTLILLNGVEIGNLDGMKTEIQRDSELVLLSVTHGG